MSSTYGRVSSFKELLINSKTVYLAIPALLWRFLDHYDACSCFSNSECVQSLQISADMDGSKSLFLITASYSIMWQTMIKKPRSRDGSVRQSIRARDRNSRGPSPEKYTEGQKILHTVLSLFIFCATLDPICEAHTAEVSNRSGTPIPHPSSHPASLFWQPPPQPQLQGAVVVCGHQTRAVLSIRGRPASLLQRP